MKKILAFTFSLLLTSNVWAADNAVVVTTGSGLTLRSRDVGAGVQSLQQILGDTSGAALATAPGVTNSVFALPIQGVTGGIAVPISGTITVTGVATAANQATEISSLATIVTNTGAAIPAGTNQIGFVGLQANTTGGCTPTRVLSAATTNSTSVKGSAGTVCSITIIQNTATAADFRFYDSASAPTCSSATGVVANYGVQANTSSPGLSPNLGPFGLNFTTGIGFCLTAYDGTDTNNSNSVTGIQINIGYK